MLKVIVASVDGRVALRSEFLFGGERYLTIFLSPNFFPHIHLKTHQEGLFSRDSGERRIKDIR